MKTLLFTYWPYIVILILSIKIILSGKTKRFLRNKISGLKSKLKEAQSQLDEKNHHQIPETLRFSFNDVCILAESQHKDVKNTGNSASIRHVDIGLINLLYNPGNIFKTVVTVVTPVHAFASRNEYDQKHILREFFDKITTEEKAMV